MTQIQQALIREHYLTSDADGKWDATTIAAMQKYQADHGWQTKLMPDSRALEKLGLGPDYSSAINAKDSTFSSSAPTSSTRSCADRGFVEGLGRPPVRPLFRSLTVPSPDISLCRNSYCGRVASGPAVIVLSR